eukprot:s3434_g4.t1
MPKGPSDSTLTGSATWPIPLPFPEVFSAGGGEDERSPLKRLVSMQILVLDWFFLDKPSAAPSSLRLGRPLTSRQWSVVRMFEHLSVDGNTPELVDAVAMGRAASKIESFEESLAAVARAVSTLQLSSHSYWVGGAQPSTSTWDDTALRCGVVVGEADVEDLSNAKPLVASRLNFPDAPTFDPLPFFDDSTAELYCYPLSRGKDPATVGDPPRVQVRASGKAKLELYRKMARCGMLQPLEEGTYLDRYRSGLFAVPKDGERDRMVLDGRPANMVDRGQSKWCCSMASAASLAGICIPEGYVAVCGGEDLRDYFYQFVVNSERTARNVLSGYLTAEQAVEVFGEDYVPKYSQIAVGLSTLAMGDCCAVEYAQASHLGLLLQCGAVEIAEILTLHGSIPRGMLQIGIVVDDLVMIEQLLRSEYDKGLDVAEGYQSAERLRRARAGYANARLANNPKKGFEGECCANFWGVDFDGDKGLLRSSQRRLWPSIVITLRVCSMGLCTIGLLESLAGIWVSLLGTRRRLYSAMELIFEPLALDLPKKTVLRLSPEMVEEMCSLAVLGTLAVVNLCRLLACN